jgi:hypothetical protein
MVSAWWLLAAFWIGGYVGILLAVLRAAHYEFNLQNKLLSAAQELPLEGEQAIPKA